MKYAITITSILILLSCANRRESQLMGSWQAFEITEEGAPLGVIPEEVRFEFLPDKTYHFQSTLNYKETGAFRVHNDYLFTRKLNDLTGQERAVLIERLSADTLVMGMEDEGKIRQIKLLRKKD